MPPLIPESPSGLLAAAFEDFSRMFRASMARGFGTGVSGYLGVVEVECIPGAHDPEETFIGICPVCRAET